MVFPEDFKRLLAESVGEELSLKALEALQAPPSVSVRLNPSKLRDCPFEGAEKVGWSPYGYLLRERPVFTLDPLFHAGCYYVQDTSAMFVGHVFRKFLKELRPGAAVLDLCAAPGGKTTDLAASLRERFGDSYTLISNEVMRTRYGALKANVENWGDVRVGTVSRDPSAFGNAPVFDLILADVPCSGEGMFRKDEKAVEDWSLGTVEFCAARSHRILADIWPVLKPGGILLFSTCTFNHLENDDTVQWAAETLGADVIPPQDEAPALRTRLGQLLLPGLVPGEGQYVAALRKSGVYEGVRTADPFALYRAERIEPSSPGPLVNVGRGTALSYLHGDAIQLPPDAPLGAVVIGFEGHPLGPGKNLGKRCNNLYPKAKRIRMDVR